MSDRSLSMGSPLLGHPEEAQLIAAVIAHWNTSEHVLAAILALLVGTDPWHAGNMLGALSSGAAKIDLVEAAGRHTLENSSRLDGFTKLVKSARSVMNTRNTLAHGIYATDEAGKLVLVRQGKDWFANGERRPLGLAQLKQDLRHAQALHAQLTEFHNELTTEMPIAPSAAWLYKAGQRRSGGAA